MQGGDDGLWLDYSLTMTFLIFLEVSVKRYDTGLTANYDQLWQLWRPWSFVECALCCLFIWDLTTSVRSCLEPKEAVVSIMLCTYICTYMHVCMTPIPLTPPTTVTVTVRAIHCTWVTHMPTASWLFLASNWTLIRYWDDYIIHAWFMQNSIYLRTNVTSWGISSKSKRDGRLRNVTAGSDGCQEPKLLKMKFERTNATTATSKLGET